MEKENNGIIKNGENPGTTQPEKKGLVKLLDVMHRKYDAIRYSRAGKIGAKVITVLGIGAAAKVGYDKGLEKGKKECIPTVVYIEKDSGETTTENTETAENTENTASETATA